MTRRGAASLGRTLAGFLAHEDPAKVLSLFADKARQHGGLGPLDFACALRACRGNGRRWQVVPEIHAKAVTRGLGKYRIVGNLLIDLYSKNGLVLPARRVFEELSARDNVSWVAMLSGYAQNGLGEEALGLYRQMHRAGVVPTPYVLSSVLSSCTKAELFAQGRLIHAQGYKHGFCSEIFVGNAVITLYLRCGSFRLAERVFCDMPHRDTVTFNTLISGHAQCGHGEHALEIFEEMQFSGLSPDCVTISSLLAACASLGDLQKGTQLHSYLFKAGISSDYIMEGSLLDLYVKCGDVETALVIFNSSDRTNVVLWNLMLVAFGQINDLAKSFELFCQMQAAGIRPNQFTYPCILRTCTCTGEIDLGEQIHSLSVKTGFESDMYVSGVLIDMYSKYGWLEKARRVLEMLKEKDVVSWTSMIAGYVQHECCKDALAAFKEMQKCGIWPDNIGLASAISGCAGIKAMRQGLQIHARIYVSGYSGDVSIWNALVNLYARCGRIREAFSSFEEIEHKDEITWNGLVSGFAQSGLHEEALKVFMRMDQSGVKHNVFTFVSALSASANLAEIKQGKQIHARVIKTGHSFETEVGNALISLYGKCGSFEDAKMEFSEMSERNEVSWNTIITSCSQHGRGLEALDLFDQMKKEGIKPNDVTFIGVLAACSHVGLVEEGLSYFKSMSDEYGIRPRPDHYACVIDIFGRAGQLDRAKKFIEEMPIAADAMVWRTLLSACKVHKNIEVGEFAAKHLLELEPHDSASYVLLSNAYAVTEKWANRDQVRKMMRDRGVRKEPGRSWIEVKNVVHAFFVGDRLHPLAEQIYNFLAVINDRVAKVGYKQEKYHLFHDKEQEGRDPTDLVHSEKLAVTFGLMSLPPCMPLRVIKNLRVEKYTSLYANFLHQKRTNGQVGQIEKTERKERAGGMKGKQLETPISHLKSGARRNILKPASAAAAGIRCLLEREAGAYFVCFQRISREYVGCHAIRCWATWRKETRTLSPRSSPYDREIHLEELPPRGLQCIASLLVTFQEYSGMESYERDWRPGENFMRGRTNLVWHLLIIFGDLGSDGNDSSIRELTGQMLQDMKYSYRPILVYVLLLYDKTNDDQLLKHLKREIIHGMQQSCRDPEMGREMDEVAAMFCSKQGKPVGNYASLVKEARERLVEKKKEQESATNVSATSSSMAT
uniref:DYW domain-containing protein n=1 Tax=Oryza meridionalis TaxID=40149 RepID=A0A0E0FD05_9ORYZ